MFWSLMLDTDGDLIDGFETADGEEYNSIAVSAGATQIAQALSLRASTHADSVWFNRAAGVDYNGLFFSTNRSDETMNPIRAQVFRDILLNTPGMDGFADSDAVSFTRTSRKLEVKLPCAKITCSTELVQPTVIG